LRDRSNVIALPETALLRPYRDSGAYTDCLTCDVIGVVTLADYVTAFYTSAAFRPERVLLSVLLGMRSSDAEAAQLGTGATDRFAAWTVEARDDDQILLCDYQSRTRSWLMVAPISGERAVAKTRLYFGTAITKIDEGRAAQALAGFAFWALLWFHKAYARGLLWGAARRFR
jgi:hypothetical protein